MTASKALSPLYPPACSGGSSLEIAAAVREIIARQAGVDAAGLSEEVRLESLGLDSLGLVELIFALEERFEISVPFNANEPGRDEGLDITSVGAVVAGVERLVAGRAA